MEKNKEKILNSKHTFKTMKKTTDLLTIGLPEDRFPDYWLRLREEGYSAAEKPTGRETKLKGNFDGLIINGDLISPYIALGLISDLKGYGIIAAFVVCAEGMCYAYRSIDDMFKDASVPVFGVNGFTIKDIGSLVSTGELDEEHAKIAPDVEQPGIILRFTEQGRSILRSIYIDRLVETLDRVYRKPPNPKTPQTHQFLSGNLYL